MWLSPQKFSASNGLLRIIIIIIAIITVGLAGGSFNRIAPENFFLTISILTLILAAAAACGTLLDFALTRGMNFKILDYNTHLYMGWLLFYASLAKLICAKRFSNSDSVAAVRVLSGVFGLLNSGLLWWLAYLTARDKQGFPCRLNTDSSVMDPEMNNVSKKPALFRANTMDGTWRMDEKWGRSIVQRIQPAVVCDTGMRQARVFTLVLGFMDLVLIASTYTQTVISEEYFLGIVCINFLVTLAAHALYLSGISTTYEDELRLIDKSYHVAGAVALILGGSIMLGSTISLRAFADVHHRTVASVIGIINGVLYAYVGLRQSNDENLHEGRTFDDASQFQVAKNVVHREPSKIAPAIMKPALMFDPTRL